MKGSNKISSGNKYKRRKKESKDIGLGGKCKEMWKNGGRQGPVGPMEE